MFARLVTHSASSKKSVVFLNFVTGGATGWHPPFASASCPVIAAAMPGHDAAVITPSLLQKLADGLPDLARMGFQSKVPGIEEAHDRVRNVALECFRTRRQKERIVLAPYRQERRLVGAEVILEGRIERDVALVVAQQVKLDVIGAGACKIEVVERVAV